jgi:hypothetical protein
VKDRGGRILGCFDDPTGQIEQRPMLRVDVGYSGDEIWGQFEFPHHVASIGGRAFKMWVEDRPTCFRTKANPVPSKWGHACATADHLSPEIRRYCRIFWRRPSDSIRGGLDGRCQ